MLRSFVLAACLLAGGWCSVPVAVSASPLGDEVTALVTLGFAKPTTNKAAVEEHFDLAQRLAPRDPRVFYGMALVHLKYHRHKDAIAVLDEARKQKAEDRFTRRARIWSLLASKQLDQALYELPLFAAEISKQAADDPQTAAEDATWCGRVLGFCSGPNSSKLSAEILERTNREVRAALTADLATQFANGEKSLHSDFAGLSGANEDAAEQAKVTEAETKQANLVELEYKKKQLEAQEQGLSAQARELATKYEPRIAELNAALPPLVTQYRQLDNEGLRLRQNIRSIDQAIFNLRQIHDQSNDPNEQLRLDREINNRILARNLQANQFAALEREAAVVQGQINQLQTELNVTQANYVAEAKKLGLQAKVVQGQQKRAERETKANLEPVKGHTAALTRNKAVMTAIATYEPFPLDAEKARLLDSFGSVPRPSE